MKFLPRISRGLSLALLLSLPGVVVVSSASADYMNEVELSPNGGHEYFDLSANGNVIASVDGCSICLYFQDYGYASVSTDGGATFTEKTSLGTQAWRGAHVSSDGTIISLVTKSGFYISTNSGSTFTYAYNLLNTLSILGGPVEVSAMSNDGKTVFLGLEKTYVIRVVYKSDTRRWEVGNSYLLPTSKYPVAIATNANATKVYIAPDSGNLLKVNGTSLSAITGTSTLPRGDAISWQSLKTSDSGNEVLAMPGNFVAGDGFAKSTDSGATFTWVTSLAGRTLETMLAVEISDDGNSTIISTYDSIKRSRVYTQHGRSASWYVRKVFTEDTYSYTMLKSNLDGSKYLAGSRVRASLHMYYNKPSPLVIWGLWRITETMTALGWRFPSDDPATDPIQAISDVQFQYATSQSGPWTTVDDGIRGASSGVVGIEGLTPFTTYYMRARAINSYGAGDWSQLSSVTTFRTPSAPLAPIDADDPDRSVIKFYYRHATAQPGEVLTGDWMFSTDGGNTWLSKYQVSFAYIYSNSDPSQPPIGEVIQYPTFNQSYLIQTRSINQFRIGPWGPSAEFKAFGKPSAVTNLAVNTQFNTANLSWSTPTYLGGDTINGYIVSYKLSNSSTWTDSATVSSTAVFSGLQGGSLYDYKVVATTVNGQQSLAAYYYNDRPNNPPTKIAITRNTSGVKSGVAFSVQPRISVQDVNSTTVTGDSRSIIFATVDKGGTLFGTDSATVSSGVATFSNLGLKGVVGTDYVITYQSADLTLARETVTVTAGAASKMRFIQNSVGGTVNTIFSTAPSIEIVDAQGNRIISDDTTTVTLTVDTGFLWNGVSSPATAVATDGVVTFPDLRLVGGNGSTPVLSYQASGFNTLQETMTLTTGTATTLTRTTRAQDAYIDGQFGTQPVYLITDYSGNPVTTSDYLISISPSQGTLTGATTVKSVNGVATFKNLGITGVNCCQMVILTVTSESFTPYTGDSVITRKGIPRLGWSDFYIPQGTPNFTVPEPDTSTAGTFTYSSSNTSVVNFSGSTLVVGSAGTAVVTATFTPTNTSNYITGETVTATFTVTQSAGSVIVSTSAGATAQKGVRNTLTASVSTLGNVTFFINGKRVPGCIGVKSVSGVATCSWKPSNQGGVTLSARLIPQDDSIDPVTSAPLNVSIVRRTGRR
jgi:hypothetical protein